MLAAWKHIRDVTKMDRLHFDSCASDLQRTQQQILLNILTLNKETTYGRHYQFSKLASASAFRDALPVVNYEDINAHIEAQTHGETAVCAEPVAFYERTSGSTAGPKHIPYTQSSLRALQQAINPWLHDLAQNRPASTQGRSYWSISPKATASNAANLTTNDGTPIGAPSDLAFLSDTLQASFVDLLSVPPLVAQMSDLNEWRYHTLFALIADEHLAFISVWNPGFLTLLIEALPDFLDRLLHDLCCQESAMSLTNEFWQIIKPGCNRQAMRERVASASKSGSINTQLLWPSLDTISCWTHGSAKQAAQTLQSHFAGTYLQPKGLLSTEAVISFPLHGTVAPVLACNSAYFEFIDNAGNTFGAHEIEIGQVYEVVVTTFGGLYRYATGDLVLVRGRFKELPCLEFTGRKGVFSDLCGEKLSEAFVANCLSSVPGFSVLTPCIAPTAQPAYSLLVDAKYITEANTPTLCATVERALEANPQYAYARHLGQLGALNVIRISMPEKHYTDYQVLKGLQLGDIKPLALCVNHDLISHLYRAKLEPQSQLA